MDKNTNNNTKHFIIGLLSGLLFIPVIEEFLNVIIAWIQVLILKPNKIVLKGNKEFVLIDDQKVIYEEALRIGINAHIHNEKSVLIVEGGPGTGKSVLAINLLKQFLNRSLNSFVNTIWTYDERWKWCTIMCTFRFWTCWCNSSQ